jgi:hypothetical protein
MVAIGWHMMLDNSIMFGIETIRAVFSLSLTWQILCLPALLLIYVPVTNWLIRSYMNLNYFALCGLTSSSVIGLPLCFFISIDKSVELYTPDLLIYYVVSGLVTGIIHYYLITFINNIVRFDIQVK